MPDLLELADRVEALEGPSREVFIEAWNAILGWEATSIKPGSKWQAFLRFLDAEAWLDAAMLLVSEGCSLQLGWYPEFPSAWARVFPPDEMDTEIDEWKGRGKSTALALVAASLRAIAQEKGE